MLNIQRSKSSSKQFSQPPTQKASAPTVQDSQKHSMVKYLLIFDPDSQQVYTQNLEDYTIHIETDVPENYRNKARDALKQIQDLIQLPGSKYNLDTDECWRYRRRQISEYLLHKMINPLPTYLAQSPMSDAFANVLTLKFYVDLSDYLCVESSTEDVNPLTIDLDIDLVTCADEVIKKILREVHNIFQVKLRPRGEENQFILKVQGFREYLSGNYPMLCYDRVRANLRGIQYIQVVLTEIPKKDHNHALFPAIFERNSKDIKAGVFSPVPWHIFQNVPTLFYYAPYPLPKYYSDIPQVPQQTQASRQSRAINQPGNRTSIFSQPNMQFQQQIQAPASQPEAKRPVYKPDGSDYIRLKPRLFMKEKESEFNQFRLKQAEKKTIQLKNNILYSGECDWPFKIRIFGITDINRIFLLDDKDSKFFTLNERRRATYNGYSDGRIFFIGLCPPQFLTKKSAMNQEVHNTAKKKSEDHNQNLKKVPIFQFPTQKINILQDQLDWIKKGNFSPHFFSHGYQGSTIMESIQRSYELDVIPYVIQLEISLMYGQKLLTPFTVAKTTKKPFRMNVVWNEVIEFSGLKISQLPMEIRLCINIIVFEVKKLYLSSQATGEEQIIGCCVIPLFDDLGRFQQGKVISNIWPFYKCDRRLACMGSYYGHGLSYDNPQEIKYQDNRLPQIKPDLIKTERGDIRLPASQEYYSKLIIGTELWEFPMYWSLRNEKIMETLGFPLKVKNRKQINANNPSKATNENENEQASVQKAATNHLIKDKEKFDDWRSNPKIDEIARLEDLLKVDPLNRDSFSQEDKYILMKCRNHYKSLPYALAIFLCAIDWSDPEQIREVYRIIRQWSPLPPSEALPLLDAIFSDEYVRFYAAQRMANQKDDELVLYMLELTQALMFEQQHFSSLVRISSFNNHRRVKCSSKGLP